MPSTYTNFPISGSKNTIVRAQLQHGQVADAPFGTLDPIAFGGIVPKNSAGFPISMSALDNLPVILGWPGQFLYRWLDPSDDLYNPSITNGLALPPRPIVSAGLATTRPFTGLVGACLCCEPANGWFGQVGTPIKMPDAVIAAGFALSHRGPPLTTVGSDIASEDTLSLINDKGASFIYIGDSGHLIDQFDINNGWLQQAFPAAASINVGSINDEDNDGGFTGNTSWYGLTIDPSCFIGGRILSISAYRWPPYTLPDQPPSTYPASPFTYWSAGVDVSGPIISGYNDPPFNTEPSYITTDFFSAFLANDIAQVSNAMKSLTKFRHVFLYDSLDWQYDNPAPAGSVGGTWVSIFPGWLGGIASLAGIPWIHVYDVDFSDQAAVDAIVQAEVNDFFS